jgi:hypothetical protein
MLGYQKATKIIRMALCLIKAEDFRIYGGRIYGDDSKFVGLLGSIV